LLEQVWLYEKEFEVPVPDFTKNPGALKQTYVKHKKFTDILDGFFAKIPSTL
jgi:hypothetical protein